MAASPDYIAVRERAGILDRSQDGILAVTGPDRLTWLQGMVSNDVGLLGPGRAALNAFILNSTGHILADVTLAVAPHRSPISTAALHGEGAVLMLCRNQPAARVAELLDTYLISEEVELNDMADRLSTVSIQGPLAERVWEPEFGRDMLAVEADHTGSGGMDVIGARDGIIKLDEAIVKWGARRTAADTAELLRIEAGLPRYGAEMDSSVLALEADPAGMRISRDKGCYMGQEVVARILSRGHTNRSLTGLLLEEDSGLVVGERLFDCEGKEVGRLTSVARGAPAAAGRDIALGYVRHGLSEPGTQLCQASGDHAGTIGTLPFHRRALRAPAT